MNQLFLQASSVTKEIMRSFYCAGRVEKVLTLLADETLCIGPGANGFKSSRAEITAYLSAGKGRVPRCDIEDDVYEVVYSGEECCVVAGQLKIRTGSETQLLVEFLQRVTFVYVIEQDALRIKHMHVSMPDPELLEGEYFPTAAGVRNYEYIQRVLAENIQAMDFLTISMKSGMKGCFEDERYSFFYVNDGLAKMLGYTHEEFMEQSGGCAVGMVYPPDRQHFLDECRRSLSEGVEYAVEYRMEKRDGTLIWVMDTGRKVHNSDGTMLLNSVVTDITELKNMVFELETERERYRIALENVTDVMFEYDILEDTFISFEKVAVEGKKRMERFEIQKFGELVKTGDIVYPDDIKKLMDIFAGRSREKIDVRIKDPKEQYTDFWSWKSVYCSVVYDADHRPVRTIGAFRDVTQEKEREEKLLHQAQRDSLTGLLNQSALKIYMKQYLLEKAPEETYALIIIDLDYFKQVNDTFGHLAGNAALIGVAEKLKHVCRSTDLIGRIGGDEFSVVLKNISRKDVLQKGDELLEAIRSVFIGDGDCFKISCSLGIAFSMKSHETYDTLFDNADKALYMAKANGRNQYVFFEEK